MAPTKFSEMKNSAELFEKLASNENILIVKFTATWCGPCKKIQSFVENKLKHHNIDLNLICGFPYILKKNIFSLPKYFTNFDYSCYCSNKT